MIQFIFKALAAAAFAAPATFLLGVAYLAVAVAVVNLFRLNYMHRPVGVWVLNAAMILTVLSYFFVFAAILSVI